MPARAARRAHLRPARAHSADKQHTRQWRPRPRPARARARSPRAARAARAPPGGRTWHGHAFARPPAPRAPAPARPAALPQKNCRYGPAAQTTGGPCGGRAGAAGAAAARACKPRAMMHCTWCGSRCTQPRHGEAGKCRPSCRRRGRAGRLAAAAGSGFYASWTATWTKGLPRKTRPRAATLVRCPARRAAAASGRAVGRAPARHRRAQGPNAGSSPGLCPRKISGALVFLWFLGAFVGGIEGLFAACRVNTAEIRTRLF